jgi:hypothetical protein
VAFVERIFFFFGMGIISVKDHWTCLRADKERKNDVS